MENRKYLVLGAVGGVVLLLLLPLLLSTCFRGGGGNVSKNNNTNSAQTVTGAKKLVVWGLFDQQDLYQGIFQKFYSEHPGVVIEYKSFNDVEEYRNLLINEIAEGKGPDVAMMHNTWIFKDRNKFAAFPTGKGEMSVEKFQKTYVGVASDDLILPDADGNLQIYGFPSSVDSLALYFNKNYFRDYVLSSTTPAEVWNTGGTNDLVSQVVKITHPDLSFERFNPAGIALGRTDNIAQGTDVLSLLMLQYGAKIYDADKKVANLANSTGVDPDTGQAVYPVLNALQLYTSFALSEYKHYSWNELITKKEPAEQEIGTFTAGKAAMIFGYSYTLDQIQQSMKSKRDRGQKTIEEDSVGIALVPQVSDNPSEGRVAYASYYPFVVPKTSQMQEEAWDLILELVSEDAQKVYFEQVHKPTSLPSLIEEQSQNPVYGIFALQASYARSLTLIDAQKMKEVFSRMVMDVVSGVSDPRKSITDANTRLQCLLDQYNKVQGREGINCLEK